MLIGMVLLTVITRAPLFFGPVAFSYIRVRIFSARFSSPPPRRPPEPSLEARHRFSDAAWGGGIAKRGVSVSSLINAARQFWNFDVIGWVLYFILTRFLPPHLNRPTRKAGQRSEGGFFSADFL